MTGQADTRLLALDRTGLEAAHVSLLAAARYRVCIYLPVVDAGLFESEAALAGLRRIATSGRHARIRLITHDANRAHREGHRLIALAQRLPTAVSIRVPPTKLIFAMPRPSSPTRPVRICSGAWPPVSMPRATWPDPVRPLA